MPNGSWTHKYISAQNTHATFVACVFCALIYLRIFPYTSILYIETVNRRHASYNMGNLWATIFDDTASLCCYLYNGFPYTCFYKRAVLSQRWPRNATYNTWVSWIFSGLPDYAHGYYSQYFSSAFVPIDPMNDPTKFEVCSFSRSWDYRAPKKIGQSLDTPTLPFLQNFE